MLKRSARWVLSGLLSIPLVRTIALRVIRVLLFNYGKYPRLDVDFADLLSKQRMHVVDESSGTDLDVTFIRYGGPSPAQDPALLDLAASASRHLRDFQVRLNEEVAAKESALAPGTMEAAFKLIPELRAPDNHYMFLTVIAEVLQARHIVEVGTASGASLCAFLASATTEFVHTFDVVPLEMNRSWLSEESYNRAHGLLTRNRHRWAQHIVDLSDPTVWREYASYFAFADIVLVDADHSGHLESDLATRMKGVLKPDAVVVWDDIRVSSLVDFWQMLDWPKLDVGGLGHLSGTGITRTGGLAGPMSS